VILNELIPFLSTPITVFWCNITRCINWCSN
jgi:hypothetical protein